MTFSAPDLSSFPLAGLVHRCQQESERYFRGQANDPTYCYEIFRRAIVERSEAAWGLLYAQYLPLVTGWVEHHSGYARTNEEANYFVNRAYEKMWSAVQPEKFGRFPDLKSLLRYLQLCVHSVIIDHIRADETTVLAEPTIVLAGVEEPILDALQQQAFWEQIQRRLHDEREQQLLYYRYGLGFKPRQICEYFPDRFPDIQEVYSITQNILARLRRDDELRQLFEAEFRPQLRS
ncbi:MAG: sigma-70 family RNA polymerase sigma factor [Caldilineaceae bacterium]|nr:sigma-70 family RNA polymerase sigma factor [Caldilineaceae bacterium]